MIWLMVIIHVLEPFASGVTSAVITITQQLPEMKHIVVHGSRMWVDRIENVKRRFPPGTEFIDWQYAGREINLLTDLRALVSLVTILKPYKKSAVVHLHSSKAGFLGRLAARLLGITRVLYTPHGASFIRSDISPFKRRFFRFLERVGGMFGGMVVGCGKSEAELYGMLEHKSGGSTFVSNGVTVIPAPVKDAAPDLITFAGIASLQKDPALFNRIAEAVPEARFCWIGDGPLRALLVAPNIVVSGWTDKTAIGGYLSRTLVYLSTAAWEGLPFGVIEAMAARCALLLRDVPGNRDLVWNNGYLFDTAEEAADILKKMLDERGHTLALGERSREIAETEYSAEKMGAGYLALYRRLWEGNGDG